MKYIEYGKHNHDTIIFLHGGGLSWWNFEDVAKSLKNDYHVVLPILDGHAESAIVRPLKFTYYMIKTIFGSCYGLMKHKWVLNLQF